MQDTIKVEKRNTRMIAHRGVSALETENTNAAFVAAGNRSYFGVETDVHLTADGRLVIIHDDGTGRVAGEDLSVEGSTYDALRALTLHPVEGQPPRSDIRIPNLEEYIGICKHYGKTAVLELKNPFDQAGVALVGETIERLGYLDHVIFISFWFDNLLLLRERYPAQPMQFLTGTYEDELPARLQAHGFDLDIQFMQLTAERVEACHAAGVKVNCWTVDRAEDAERLIGYGVDFITSNALE